LRSKRFGAKSSRSLKAAVPGEAVLDKSAILDESMLLQRITGFIERHGMFRAGQAVGVAVSGGADSVCLLYLLRELAHHWALRLQVLHLNHNLRGEESVGDAGFVRELAGALGLPVTIHEARFDAADGNLEQAARQARLAFFRARIAAGAVDRVAVGHTRSDQAETVLFRFLRGAGTAGLSGIRPVTTDGIVRPLLEVDRVEVEGFLRERGIRWREDSSNVDPRFDRNRIRHQLLPQLVRDWNPALAEALAQTADWAQAEESWWESEVDRLAGAMLIRRPGVVFLKAGQLSALPLAAGRRLVRRALEVAKGNLRGVDFGHIASILRLASNPRGHGRVQAPGVAILRSFDWLRIGPPHSLASRESYSQAASVPGAFRVPGSDLEVCLELIEKPETSDPVNSVYNCRMGGLDWQRLSGRLEWRSWQAGDRYRPSGSTGEEKIKTLFQRARIPVWERRYWPVLTDGPSIVWVRQFGPAAEFEANSGSRWVLVIRENGASGEIGIGSARDGV
jgi:tRNA(Ile)-lysidine synthase